MSGSSKKVVSIRLSVETIAKLKDYADRTGETQGGTVERALEAFFGAQEAVSGEELEKLAKDNAEALAAAKEAQETAYRAIVDALREEIAKSRNAAHDDYTKVREEITKSRDAAHDDLVKARDEMHDGFKAMNLAIQQQPVQITESLQSSKALDGDITERKLTMRERLLGRIENTRS